MEYSSRIFRNAETFADALDAIDRANGTDAASTRNAKYDDIFAILDSCISVCQFHKNVTHDVRKLNCDVDQTTLPTAARGINFCNSNRAVNNATAALAQKCNNSVVENGSLATYKTASNKNLLQRARTETVARHVYNQVRALVGANQIYRSAEFTAMIVGECAFLMKGNRFYIVSGYEVLEKHSRAAVKDLGFRQSTTSMVMYLDAANANFNTIAQSVLREFQFAVNSQTSTTQQNRILNSAYSLVA